LLADPWQWPLLHVRGDLAVFGWRDPSAAGVDPFRDVELDLNHLAFHPTVDKKAPDRPSASEPEARQWWEAFWKPEPPRPVDQGEATLHALHAEVVRRSAPWRHAVAWESCQFTACVGAAGGWSGPASLLDAHLRLTLLRPPMAEQGRRFQTLPVFDQMAYAWRALAVNPNDAQIYLVLEESYMGLLHNTRERVWRERMPELVQLRRSQASAALNQARAGEVALLAHRRPQFRLEVVGVDDTVIRAGIGIFVAGILDDLARPRADGSTRCVASGLGRRAHRRRAGW
jgi:hypothetical protein